MVYIPPRCYTEYPDEDQVMFGSLQEAMDWLRDNCIVIPEGINVDIIVADSNTNLRVWDKTVLDHPYGDRINIINPSFSLELQKTIELDESGVPDDLSPVMTLSNNSINVKSYIYHTEVNLNSSKTIESVESKVTRELYLKVNDMHSMSCTNESKTTMYMISSVSLLLFKFEADR